MDGSFNSWVEGELAISRIGLLEEMFEIEKAPICKCVRCGRTIEFCTRDNPCPVCCCSLFRVEYRQFELPIDV